MLWYGWLRYGHWLQSPKRPLYQTITASHMYLLIKLHLSIIVIINNLIKTIIIIINSLIRTIIITINNLIRTTILTINNLINGILLYNYKQCFYWNIIFNTLIVIKIYYLIQILFAFCFNFILIKLLNFTNLKKIFNLLNFPVFNLFSFKFNLN